MTLRECAQREGVGKLYKDLSWNTPLSIELESITRRCWEEFQ